MAGRRPTLSDTVTPRPRRVRDAAVSCVPLVPAMEPTDFQWFCDRFATDRLVVPVSVGTLPVTVATVPHSVARVPSRVTLGGIPSTAGGSLPINCRRPHPLRGWYSPYRRTSALASLPCGRLVSSAIRLLIAVSVNS